MRGVAGGDGVVPKGIGGDMSGTTGGIDPQEVTPLGRWGGVSNPSPSPPWGVFNAAVGTGCPGMNFFHGQE